MTTDRRQISQWMTQASRGSRGAYERLAIGVQDGLFRLALGNGLCASDAAEAVQETLLRGYRQRLQFRQDSDALAWLTGIAMNVIRELRRQNVRGHRLDIEYLLHLKNRSAEGLSKGDRDYLDDLAEALEQLPPRQREAVVCRYLRRMTIEETAQAMGCAEGTVKSTVSAALELLRRKVRLES